MRRQSSAKTSWSFWSPQSLSTYFSLYHYLRSLLLAFTPIVHLLYWEACCERSFKSWLNVEVESGWSSAWEQQSLSCTSHCHWTRNAPALWSKRCKWELLSRYKSDFEKQSEEKTDFDAFSSKLYIQFQHFQSFWSLLAAGWIGFMAHYSCLPATVVCPFLTSLFFLSVFYVIHTTPFV